MLFLLAIVILLTNALSLHYHKKPQQLMLPKTDITKQGRGRLIPKWNSTKQLYIKKKSVLNLTDKDNSLSMFIFFQNFDLNNFYLI